MMLCLFLSARGCCKVLSLFRSPGLVLYCAFSAVTVDKRHSKSQLLDDIVSVVDRKGQIIANDIMKNVEKGRENARFAWNSDVFQ